MAFVIDAFDEKKQDGTWIDYDGSRFLVAWSGNPKYIAADKRIKRVNRVSEQKAYDKISDDKKKEILCEALSEGVLLGWEDVILSDGSDFPYTQDNAKKALLMNHEFLTWVLENAVENDNYRKELTSETVKK